MRERRRPFTAAAALAAAIAALAMSATPTWASTHTHACRAAATAVAAASAGPARASAHVLAGRVAAATVAASPARAPGGGGTLNHHPAMTHDAPTSAGPGPARAETSADVLARHAEAPTALAVDGSPVWAKAPANTLARRTAAIAANASPARAQGPGGTHAPRTEATVIPAAGASPARARAQGPGGGLTRRAAASAAPATGASPVWAVAPGGGLAYDMVAAGTDRVGAGGVVRGARGTATGPAEDGPTTSAAADDSEPGGEVIPTGAGDPGGAEEDVTTGALWVPVAALGGVVLLALYVLHRRRARMRPVRTSAGRGAIEWRPGRPKQPVPVTPLPELDAQARALLVATDDAVRTSREDVRSAAGQCGEAAARPFAEAVRYAEDEVGAAFRLRQKLDGSAPEGSTAADDETRRQMLDEILSRCTQADRRLDAESEAFDRLRAMEAHAPEVLERAETAAVALTERITATRTVLAALAERYAATALEPVAGRPAEAVDRLAFARGSLEQARATLGTDHGRTAVLVRAAEGALDQAAALTASVTRRARELRTAEDALRDALAEAGADLAAARELLAAPGGTPPPDPRDLAADVDAVLTSVRQEAARPDPFAAVRRLDQAADALAAALTAAHERGPNGQSGPVEARATGMLGRALLMAGSEVAAARDEVTTHRGAVGSAARTRLAEAERRLRRAEEAAAGEPREALSEARAADRLAREATSYAQQDVSRFSGGLGAVNGDTDGRAGGDAGSLHGAVLGGILLGDLAGGGTRGSYGFGGYGGGLGGGSLGSGPAAFGGSRTRTRLGSTGTSDSAP